MAAPGVRWFSPLPHLDVDADVRRVVARARRRRIVLDAARKISRAVVGYLEVWWAQAARDARDALDTQRADPR